MNATITRTMGAALLVTILGISMTGCASKVKKPEGFAENGGFESHDPWGRSESELLATRVYYFGFDSYSLSDKDRATVTAHARHLGNNHGQKVTVAGHTDERGSREYNIALAERRSKAVWDEFSNHGVSREQVRLVSYGKERPQNPGHDESAWAENRRAELIYE